MITTTITAILLGCWKLALKYFENKKQLKKEIETTSTPEVVLPVITKVEDKLIDKKKLPNDIIEINKPSDIIIDKPVVKVESKLEPKIIIKEEVKVVKTSEIKVIPIVEKEHEKEHEKDSENKSKIIAQLVVKRNTFTAESTIGDLFIDGKFVCYTLEDKDRKLESGGTKIYGETAIPRGIYEVIINWSNRFQCYLPLLLNVPQFEGIRFHFGNTKDSTYGCLLGGFHKSENMIQQSRDAVKFVIDIIAEKLKTQKVYIKIQ